jgi:5-methylcytosine-specific restriction endonuclease McrA
MRQVAKRQKLKYTLQVRVFRRDGWLCRWCGRPVVFASALKYLDLLVKESQPDARLAYFDLRWRRDAAPLLDHLAAVVDHLVAFSQGGADAEANFVTACNKCNSIKSAPDPEKFEREHRLQPIKGKYGEPKYWDGLAAVFVHLAKLDEGRLTRSEKGWLDALTSTASSEAPALTSRAASVLTDKVVRVPG